MKKRYWLVVLAISIVATAAITAIVLTQEPSEFERAAPKDIDYILFYPDEIKSGYAVDYSTIKYDTEHKGTSFVVTGKGNKLTFAEQTTPDQFNDIPQYWQGFTDKLNGYKSFDSPDGKVALIRPQNLNQNQNQKQAAVFNGKGTLMFIYPEKDLSDSDWRNLFKNMSSTE